MAGTATEPKITIEEEKGVPTLIIRVPLDPKRRLPLSSTGKSHIAASTGGFSRVPGADLKVNLTVTSPNETVQLD